jgi:hypothetical protein
MTYGLTVVVPFYKRYDEFIFSFEKNQCFYNSNYQIVLVLDEPTQKDLVLGFVKTKETLTNWKVLINENDHDWRNPAKALNVGIKNSDSEMILVLSPETIMINNVIEKFMSTICLSKLKSFAIGKTYDSNMQEIGNYLHEENFFITNCHCRGFHGSIMFHKKYADSIGGFDEKLEYWGGDDYDFRKRMILYGIKKIEVNDSVCVHVDHKKVNDEKKWINIKNAVERDKLSRIIHYAVNYRANEGIEWGTSFDKIIFENHIAR